MEPYDEEEDREYRARYERRQRMRQERQRRRRRQRMLKRILCLVILGVVMVLIVVAVRSCRKAGEDDTPKQEQQPFVTEPLDWSEIEKIIEEQSGKTKTGGKIEPGGNRRGSCGLQLYGNRGYSSY